MEDGDDTKYWEGPRGRVPWMKPAKASVYRDSILPESAQRNNHLVRLIRLQCNLTKVALLEVLRGMRNNEE